MHTPAGFEPAHAMPEEVHEHTIVFAFSAGKVPVSDSPDDHDAAIVLPRHGEMRAYLASGTAHFLGTLHGEPCVAVNLDSGSVVDSAPRGWRFSGLRALFFRVPEPLLALAGRAFQVVEWDRTHRFCGQCGARMQDK